LEIKREIKRILEELNGKIDGILSINVYIDGIKERNADVCLIVDCESKESFEYYLEHPLHKQCGLYIRPRVENRMDFDFKL